MSTPREGRQKDLFRPALADIVDPRHALVRLASEIDWGFLDRRLRSVCTPGPGQPPLPTRLVAGLLILKHMHSLSDEVLCARWLENPYFQLFCGEHSFQHALPFERARKALRFLRTRLGRVIRDIDRKSAGDPALRAEFAPALDRARRVRDQDQRKRGRKLYALHAPEVEGIGKGKARTPWEFGCKVSVATPVTKPKGGQFVLHARALHGNPFDGHTLDGAVTDVQAMTGIEVRRIHVDKGYRGHDYPNRFRVWITGQVRRVTPTIKKEMRRRAAVEPVIGHLKAEHRMGRNHLKGYDGDRANPVLAAAGYNFRLLIRWLERLLRALFRALAQPAIAPDSRARQPLAA